MASSPRASIGARTSTVTNPDLLTAIRRDGVLQAGVIVWIVTLLPSLVPVLGPELTLAFADQYSDAASLLVVVAAAFLALRAAALGRERLFWSLVMGAAGAILAVRLLYLVLPDDVLFTQTGDVLTDVLYVASYLVLIYALERRPDRGVVRGLRWRMQQLQLIGGLVFSLGVLTYFIVIPSVFDPAAYMSLLPSLAMYIVLDAYIVIRLVTILRGRTDGEWRWPYIWLAVTYGLWFVADSVEALLLLESIPWIDPGTPLDVLWHVPVLALLVSVRSRGWPVAGEWDNGSPPATEERIGSLLPERTDLLAMTVALPGVHFALGVSNLRFDGLNGPREVVLFFTVGILTGLLVRHHQLMRQLAWSIDADRQLVADQLHIAQRMEAVGRLASGVAHDFSNILSVIRGRAELLMMTNQVRDPGQDDVTEIVEASRRGQSLVTHLLTIGRRQSTEAEVFDVATVVEELHPLLERVLPDSVDLIVTKGEGGLPIVHADRAHLEQVVLNLVVNARDAMPDGGTLRIRAETTEVEDHFAVVHGGVKGGEYTVLSVSDTGAGVAPELRQVIFEPFFTTKEDDAGTGLGLSIVYGVARSGHGFVRVADAPGGGALFEIYLPRAREEPKPAARVRERRRVRSGQETILLVEDYEALRKTASRVLQESGYRVLEAESAAEALAILERRNERIELLVSDLVLPDLSGFELEARALDQLPDLATVFISGYPEGVTPLRIPEAATILEKPFSPEVLTFTVRRVLDERKRFTG